MQIYEMHEASESAQMLERNCLDIFPQFLLCSREATVQALSLGKTLQYVLSYAVRKDLELVQKAKAL